jgi:hypothetical protein
MALIFVLVERDAKHILPVFRIQWKTRSRGFIIIVNNSLVHFRCGQVKCKEVLAFAWTTCPSILYLLFGSQFIRETILAKKILHVIDFGFFFPLEYRTKERILFFLFPRTKRIILSSALIMTCTNSVFGKFS